jgi:hypothetical protein
MRMRPMQIAGFWLAALAAVVLTGCAAPITVVGYTGSYDEIFRGSGANTGTSSQWEAVLEPSNVRCTASAKLIGGRWSNRITCSDGRTATVETDLVDLALSEGTGRLSDGTTITVVRGIDARPAGYYERFLREHRQVSGAAPARDALAAGGQQIIEPALARQGTPERSRPEPDSYTGTGLYALEEELAFNVLDGVAFDPATRKVTLIGHADPRHVGPRIPYLQHLATLLEHPDPEFTLQWPPETERAVTAFLRRMDDPREMAAFAGTAGAMFTPEGMPTAAGRRMLARAGIHPIAENRPPGVLGLRVRSPSQADQTFGVIVQEVVPGSPAGRAGFRAGDQLMLVHGKQLMHPQDFVGTVRRAGAGARIEVQYSQKSGGLRKATVTLGEGSGDPWNGYTRVDVVALLLRHTGNRDGAELLEAMQSMQRLIKDPYLGLPALHAFYLAATTPLRGVKASMDDYNAVFADVRAGRLTQQQGIRRIFVGLLKGMEHTLRFPAASLTGPYDRAVRRGIDPASAYDAILGDINRQTEAVVTGALRTVLRRQEEIVTTTADIARRTGVKPVVVPHYLGLPPDSQTARAMFQADYLGKTLFFAPGLARRVPGYRTEYAHDIERGVPAQRDVFGTRAWLSVGELALAQSEDANVLDIRTLKMRVNMRDSRRGGAEVDTPGGYPERLTALYDDMARLLPPLHELREVAKVRVAALWILSKAPDFRLPKEGRRPWRGPEAVPMPVHLIWSPHHDRVRAVASGGVSLSFPGVPPVPPGVPLVPVLDYPVPMEPSVVDLRGLRDRGVTALPDPRIPGDASIVDLSHLDLAATAPLDLKTFDARPRIRIAREVPLPPPPYGGTRLARKGDGLLRSLNLRVPAGGPQCDAEQLAALSDEVEEVKRLIGELQMVEAAMNLVSQSNPQRQAQQDRLTANLRKARADLETGAIDLATRGMLDAYDVMRIRSELHGLGEVTQGVDLLLDAHDRVGKTTKDWNQKIERLQLAYRAATADDLASMERALSDVAGVMGEVLAGLESLPGDDKASKVFRTAGKVVKKAKKAKELMDTSRSVSGLAGLIRQRLKQDRMDDMTARNLQREYKKRFDAVMQAIASPGVQALQEGRIPAQCG